MPLSIPSSLRDEGKEGEMKEEYSVWGGPFSSWEKQGRSGSFSKMLSEDFLVRTKVWNPCLFLMVFSGERTLILSQLRQGRTVASGLTTPWFNTALVYSVLALCIHVVW